MDAIMKRIVYVLICSIGLFSCTDMDMAPNSNLSPENFFKSEADAVAAVLGVYPCFTAHNIYNQYWEVLQSQGTDDSEWGGGRTTTNLDKNALDKFQYDANTTLIYALWSEHYNIINRTNFAIENIREMSPDIISDPLKSQLVGEAKFLRALAYYNLIRLYGGVPLVLKETVSLEGLEIPKNTLDECYDQIIEDLKEAASVLPGMGGSPASYLGRATKGSAAGLLASVYLTKGDYPNVVTQTAEVMQMGYSLWDNYGDNFDVEKENGKESLFEIQFLRNTPGVGGSSFNGYYRPPFVDTGGWTGYGDNPVTKNHYDCYEEGDVRRGVNVRLYSREEYPNMPSNYEFPCYVNKFQDLSPLANRSASENNYPILRYSEILLMRAEALNAINTSDPEAYELLNTVRRRAFGRPMHTPSDIDIQTGLSEEEFINQILDERRREFAFEGKRRFDLLRTGKLKEMMIKQNPEIGSLISDKHNVLPIPVSELDANELLEQNPGW